MKWPLHMTILQGKCSDILRQGEAQVHIFPGGNKVLSVVYWRVTISDIGWVGKEQLVNEWLEKWVHHKNFRRQTAKMLVDQAAYALDKQQRRLAKKKLQDECSHIALLLTCRWNNTQKALLYYNAALQILLWYIKYKYVLQHTPSYAFLFKQKKKKATLFTHCKPDVGNRCKLNSIVKLCHV